MKHVGRTLMILLAALMVVAAAIGYSYTTFAGDLAPAAPIGIPGELPAGFDGAASGDAASAAVQVEHPTPPAGEGRTEEGHAGGWFGPVEIAKNLTIMGLMVGVVAAAPQGAQRLCRLIRRQRPDSPPPPQGV